MEMGAKVEYCGAKEGCAPFKIIGSELQGKSFNLKIASAQVQTALLLAGLQAKGKTTVSLPETVRDHTLKMFQHIGVPYEINDVGEMTVTKLDSSLPPYSIEVPADISSAAFFMVAAACLPGSDLLLKNVAMNEGRRLVVDVLLAMGADLKLENTREAAHEPIADIRIKGHERLKGIEITSEKIPQGVDEIPILALAGAFCDGQFSVRGAEELRHKESDRLEAIVSNLKNAGAIIEPVSDGFDITGKKTIAGGSFWKTHKDHRLAMTGLVAQLLFDSPVELEETGSVAISYPQFAQDLGRLNTHK
jgi:3-phosphoshikimate 1-carboxyvinyltransferase